METTTFKLLTGVECEITELTGEHQESFTKKGKKGDNPIDKMLVQVVKRIGSKTNITLDDIEKLLEQDKILILIELRKLTFGDTFEFKYKFSLGQTDVGFPKKTQPYPVSVDLSEIQTKPYKMLVDDILVPMDFKEYADVLQHVKVPLKLSKGEIVFINLPNGKSQQINKNELSILTKITMLEPYYINEVGAEIPYTIADIKKMSGGKLGDIAKKATEYLGFVDIMVEMPNPELADETEAINLMSVPDFLLQGYL
jgi:hypothetical protein